MGRTEPPSRHRSRNREALLLRDVVFTWDEVRSHGAEESKVTEGPPEPVLVSLAGTAGAGTAGAGTAGLSINATTIPFL